jgi:hypothetical protein
MNGLHTSWDNRSAEQWLEQAARFEKMAGRFDHHPQLNASFTALARDAAKRAGQRLESSDLDYFRMRAGKERGAAAAACDMRARRVHLEMAERYNALVRGTESEAALRLIS